MSGHTHNEANHATAHGCELCGDFPVELHARCHPSAPLRVQRNANDELELFCYLPSCNRHVATLKLAVDKPS